jgi:hypothetical protein
MFDALFGLAGAACLACFAVLVGGVCPGRLAEPRDAELLFLSEYITICMQSDVFQTVPWVLAYAVAASMLCVLASWEAGARVQAYSLAMHMLVFHFCLNIACVVEFRTDGAAPARNSVLLPKIYSDEAFAHKLAALQAIVDFACVHLIIAAHARSPAAHARSPAARGGLSALQLACYRAAEVFYACATSLFLACWLLQSMLAAAVFEWLLVACALLMQWYGEHRSARGANCVEAAENADGVCGAGADDADDADKADATGAGRLPAGAPAGPQPLVGLFRERHFAGLLGAYVLFNVLSVVVFTEPRWDAAPAGEPAALSSGPEFWVLVALAAAGVAASAAAGRAADARRALLAY